MPEPGFAVWLERRYPGQPTGVSRFSNVQRIESAYGDLRDHHRRDRCAAVMADLACSGRDRASGKANKSRIVFGARSDVYNGLSTLRGALRLYVEYLDGVSPDGRRTEQPHLPLARSREPAPAAAPAESSAVVDLLRAHARTLDALRDLGVVRTGNVVGEYGEWLFARAFGWALASPSEKSHDATDGEGLRYQIKARRDAGRGGATQLGIMRNLGEDGFDAVAAVIFEADFTVRHGVLIPREVIAEHAVFTSHQRGHLLNLTRAVLADPRTRDVTDALRDAARA